MLDTIVDYLNGLLWGKVLVYGLVAVGAYFTLRLLFIQVTYFRHAAKLLGKSRQGAEGGLSSFQVFCTSMAARVGAGNMAGVAVAITAGGAGAIFWMWLIAILGMATSMVESTLAQIFKIRDNDGQFRGGPAYYMERGLGMRWMGSLFSIFLIIAFGLVFNAVQANTITGAMESVFDIQPLYMGVFLVVSSAFVIAGGLKKVAQVSEVLVPFMAIAYIGVAFMVVVTNADQLPAVFSLIIHSAFGWQEAASGAVGYTIAQAMQAGIARGLFSNEAGMGSAANVAASATPNPNHPASQGFIQMMGVFFDTIIICTATAAIILLAPELAQGDGIGLTIAAMNSHVGDWGGTFIGFAILLFCFTSIIANYSYAETNMMFLSNNNATVLMVFKLGVLAMVMFGAIAKINIVWNLADVSMGLMATVNLVALVMLSGLAVKVIKDYQAQVKAGVEPEFDTAKFPELAGKIDPTIWPALSTPASKKSDEAA